MLKLSRIKCVMERKVMKLCLSAALLRFTASTMIGDIRNTSNRQFTIAILNNREPAAEDLLLMTSTLLTNLPLDEFNGLALTCIETAIEGGVDGMNITPQW